MICGFSSLASGKSSNFSEKLEDFPPLGASSFGPPIVLQKARRLQNWAALMIGRETVPLDSVLSHLRGLGAELAAGHWIFRLAKLDPPCQARESGQLSLQWAKKLSSAKRTTRNWSFLLARFPVAPIGISLLYFPPNAENNLSRRQNNAAT